MSEELPKGWVSATLQQIAEINPRHPKGLDDAMPITFVPMAGLSESKPEFQFTEVRPLGDVRKGFTHFAEGDVLFAKITPCMENGKGAVARGLRNQLGCGTTELHVIRPFSKISPEYIYRFLAQESIRRAAKDNFTGTAGQARVPTGFIEELKIPLAPFAEQKRIVGKLEELLAHVDSCKQRLSKIAAVLKRFRRSVLAAACSGRLTADWREENGAHSASLLLDIIAKKRKKLWTEQRQAKELPIGPKDYPEPANPSDDFEFDVPETWAPCSMDALVSTITSGSRDWKQYYQEEGSGTFIMAQNVRPLRFDSSYRLAVAPPENNRDRTRSQASQDDLLVTIVGANTGDSCRIPNVISEHYICQSVALMRPVLSGTSRFLELFLNSSGHGLAQYRKWIYGEGRPHLSFDNLRETLVNLPPLEEQQEIVRRVETLFALADEIEARFDKARQQVEKLTPSLLARAFRGELVPQDRKDEPASALLSRIEKGRS